MERLEELIKRYGRLEDRIQSCIAELHVENDEELNECIEATWRTLEAYRQLIRNENEIVEKIAAKATAEVKAGRSYMLGLAELRAVAPPLSEALKYGGKTFPAILEAVTECIEGLLNRVDEKLVAAGVKVVQKSRLARVYGPAQ
jgi:predicted DNA-binding protein YlxM (UPF0122 family)